MVQAKKSENSPIASTKLNRLLCEAAFLGILALALFLFSALVTYHIDDPSWRFSGTGLVVENSGGVVGAWLADLLLFFTGYLGFLFPCMLINHAWMVLSGVRTDHAEPLSHYVVRWSGFIAALLTGTSLLELHFYQHWMQLPMGPGGLFGKEVSNFLISLFGHPGATLLMLSVFLAGVTLSTGMSWLWLMDRIGALSLKSANWILSRLEAKRETKVSEKVRKQRTESFTRKAAQQEKKVPPRIEPVLTVVEPSERLDRERQVPLFESKGDGSLPPLALLDQPEPHLEGYSREALQAMSQLVEMKLRDFGVDVEVVAVHPGPVITRFEVQPAPGIKASRISGLAQDLARSMSTHSVRVVEVIPGKSVIGLEIPNEAREIVRLSEILSSQAYEKSRSPLTLVLGKDIAGQPVVADLAKMPHLLVAGTTGSGKSVAINAMILSLLYKARADEVRMIMIDPKMLELSVYEGIPHLLTPVVTDMKQAANALRWCVAEMERRYHLMSLLGVRNLSGFNKKVRQAIESEQPIPDPLYQPNPLYEDEEVPTLTELPNIVIVIDELADMMMVVGKKVEELIARLAQKARAAGLHLVLATQRPSVDVLTGLIKANIPTRIAFQVSSKIDSRTILDQGGAETLLGNGDMLFLPPGTGIPNRVHGAFVDDHEVHKVVKHLKKGAKTNYVEGILTGAQLSDDGFTMGAPDTEDVDELYDQALRIVTETRRASISGVQRQLKIGYNRAARMIEEMERVGVVGPLQSNGSREVLAPPPPEV